MDENRRMKVNTKIRTITGIAGVILILAEFPTMVAIDKHAVYQWPTVRGRITEASESRRAIYNTDANGNPSYEYYVTIGFSYTVGGENYFNRAEVRQGHAGQVVTVYYNPKDPMQSAVTRGGGSQISQPVETMIVAAFVIQLAAIIIIARRMSNTDKKSIGDNNEVGEQQ